MSVRRWFAVVVAALLITTMSPLTARPTGPDDVHAPAAECLAAGNVWVVVERDTGLQQAGCATEFADGREALESAGFEVTGTDFITHIGGYPTESASGHYWSYWHATDPEVTEEERDGELITTSSFDWEYSQLGATSYEPQPGTIEGWRFIDWISGAPPSAPSWQPVIVVSEPVEPQPTLEPTPPAPTPTTPAPTTPAPTTPAPTTPAPTTPAPTTPAPSPSAGPTPFERTAPYTLPGLHKGLNGRDWNTSCEEYSQTERCRTEIWATTVVIEDGRFVRKNGWVFNNLTYLPFLSEAQWRGNPLGDVAATSEGLFTSAGRQWRTECHTATTGRGGCRSYVLATVYAATARPGGGYSFTQSDHWVFNNIVLFKAS